MAIYVHRGTKEKPFNPREMIGDSHRENDDPPTIQMTV
jgi:hypothetical protein